MDEAREDEADVINWMHGNASIHLLQTYKISTSLSFFARLPLHNNRRYKKIR